MMKFQYMSITSVNSDWECELVGHSYILSNSINSDMNFYLDIIEVLNILGEDGWELVSKESEFKWILKRKYEDL